MLINGNIQENFHQSLVFILASLGENCTKKMLILAQISSPPPTQARQIWLKANNSHMLNLDEFHCI